MSAEQPGPDHFSVQTIVIIPSRQNGPSPGLLLRAFSRTQTFLPVSTVVQIMTTLVVPETCDPETELQ